MPTAAEMQAGLSGVLQAAQVGFKNTGSNDLLVRRFGYEPGKTCSEYFPRAEMPVGFEPGIDAEGDNLKARDKLKREQQMKVVGISHAGGLESID